MAGPLKEQKIQITGQMVSRGLEVLRAYGVLGLQAPSDHVVVRELLEKALDDSALHSENSPAQLSGRETRS